MFDRTFFAIASILLVTFLLACELPYDADKNDPENTDNPVEIVDKGTHFDITINYTKGYSNKEIGKAYATEIKKGIPCYEQLLDSYLQDLCDYNASVMGIEKQMLFAYAKVNMENILPQIQGSYQEELEGIVSAFDTINELGDGKLSRDELYIITLITDVTRGVECSAVSAFGDASSIGVPITARNLEWPVMGNQLAQVQAVTTFIQNDKSIKTVGYVGHLGVLTAVNDDQIFAAILDSPTGNPYSSVGKRSYIMDLRYALEKFSTIDEIAGYMTSSENLYTFGHLIVLTDKQQTVVVENDLARTRAVRYHDSQLHDGVQWEMENTIGAVNSFVLSGNRNILTGIPSNENRWERMRSLLVSAREDNSAQGDLITPREIQNIITSYTGSAPQSQTLGDLYSENTQQLIIYEPNKSSIQVYFRPKAGGLDIQPVFIAVPLSF